ncbi:MAG: hypothetical protein ABSH41_04080 [Syntrophobacteraceae bacterium]|jgi:hypothetical protein
MKNGAILLMLLLFVCTGAGYSAQASDSKEWDILGVKLGMSLEDAASVLKSTVPPRAIEPLKSTFQTNPASHFKTPALITGARDLSYGNQMFIACDLAQPAIIIGLYRTENYQTKPSFDIVYKSLVDKYGKPDKTDKQNNNITYVWLSNSNKSLTTIDSLGYIREITNLSSGADPEASMPGAKGAGKMMLYSINLDGNGALVSFVACGFIDTDRIFNSRKYLQKVMADGDASEAAKAKMQGDQTKPKF